MLTGLRIAASGLLVQQRNLDVVAHNIANADTIAFKRLRLAAQDLPNGADRFLALGGAGVAEPVELGRGVALAGIERLVAPGPLLPTDHPLDLALGGDTFLVVAADGRTAYTRDGALELDAAGRLTTAGGYVVQPEIVVPAEATAVRIDGNGQVWATLGAEEQVVGQLQVARFGNPAGLLAIGNGLFVPTVNAGAPTVGAPGAGDLPALQPGMLEASNVELAAEFTRMLQAQRAYQLNLRALQAWDEMIGQAANVRR